MRYHLPHGFMPERLRVPMTLACLVLAPQIAFADVIVQVFAAPSFISGEPQATAFIDSSTLSPAPSAVYGQARSTRTPQASSASAHAGTALGCELLVVGPGCFLVGETLAQAAGDVTGDMARFRATTHASMNFPDETPNLAHGSIFLTLVDTLIMQSAGVLSFDFNLTADLDLTASDGVANGVADYVFVVKLNDIEFYRYEAIRSSSLGTEGPFHVDVHSNKVSQSFAAGANVKLTMFAFLESACTANIFLAADQTCTATADSRSTSFLGISGNFTSQNNYGYPGFDPGSTGGGGGGGGGGGSVPEPATLMLLSVSAVFACRRRKQLSRRGLVHL